MRRLLRVGVLLLAGCQNLSGPPKRPIEQVNNPYLSVGEQMRKGRDQLAFPDGNPSVLPRTGAEIPNATGR